jgi:DNA-binding transcriptional LysR family regulator
MAISTDMLDAFVKVAEHLGVSAAANDLGIAKGVISKRVAQLEQLVGATLFSRSTRRVALTPAGETYLPFARNALREMRAAAEGLRALRAELTGQIRLTAPFSWGQSVLSKLLPPFLAAHPALEIELLLEDRLMDIAYDRIDIALRMTATTAHEFMAMPLARLEWVVCAAPAYLSSSGIPMQPADLRQHPCMAYWRDPSDAHWQFAGAERRVSVPVHSRFRANNPEAVADCALAGLGIALLPRYVCEAELAQGRLVPLLSDWTAVTKFGDGITAVIAPDRLRLSRNQALLRYLQDRLA